MPINLQSDLESISAFDPHLWSLLKNKKIFATGCTGFIGTWIIHSFLYVNEKYNLGAELCCLTRDPLKNETKFPSVKFIEGDIQDFTFPLGKFDYVIHGATEVATYQNGTDVSSLFDVSYLGTKNIINFAKSAGVQKILFLSSGAAYGIQPLDLPLLTETYGGGPLVNDPKSTYGEAKRLSEMLLFNENIPATSARIFAACGPFLPMASQYAFSNFLKAALENEKIVIKSNGKTTRSYLYAGDIVLWLWILLLKGRDKEIYNVGSDEEISIHQLASMIKTTLNKELEIEVQGKEEGFGRYIPSNQKIKTEFNIKKLVPLELGIKKSYDYLKDNYAVQ